MIQSSIKSQKSFCSSVPSGTNLLRQVSLPAASGLVKLTTTYCTHCRSTRKAWYYGLFACNDPLLGFFIRISLTGKYYKGEHLLWIAKSSGLPSHLVPLVNSSPLSRPPNTPPHPSKLTPNSTGPFLGSTCQVHCV